MQFDCVYCDRLHCDGQSRRCLLRYLQYNKRWDIHGGGVAFGGSWEDWDLREREGDAEAHFTQ